MESMFVINVYFILTDKGSDDPSIGPIGNCLTILSMLDNVNALLFIYLQIL